MGYLLLATICFSLSFGMIRSNLATLPSAYVATLTLLLAAIIFLPVAKFKNNLQLQIKALLIGMLQFGLMNLCYLKAFQTLQGNEVAILTTTTPIFVAIFASLTGEKFRIGYILCIILAVVGAATIVWQRLPLSNLLVAILFMESANISFAIGQILWRHYLADNSAAVMSSAYLGGALFTLPFAAIVYPLIPFPLSYPQLGAIAYKSIIATGLGYFLWNKGATKVNAGLLAIANNLKIPFGVFFAITIFHEKISLWPFISGTTMIIISIILLQFLTRKNSVKN